MSSDQQAKQSYGNQSRGGGQYRGHGRGRGRGGQGRGRGRGRGGGWPPQPNFAQEFAKDQPPDFSPKALERDYAQYYSPRFTKNPWAQP